MIDHNKEHAGLTNLVTYVEMLDKKISNNYRVYGLKKVDVKSKRLNPLILVEFNKGHVNPEKLAKLSEFFKDNNIHFHAQELNDNKGIIYIGLRRDFREDKELCASALKTLIYHFEDKLEITPGVKLKNIPTFEMKIEIFDNKE